MYALPMLSTYLLAVFYFCWFWLSLPESVFFQQPWRKLAVTLCCCCAFAGIFSNTDENNLAHSLGWACYAILMIALPHIPDGTYLDLTFRRLTSLQGITIPDEVVTLNCSHNNLRTLKGLEMNTTIRTVFCSHNLLVSLNHLPLRIETVNARGNCLHAKDMTWCRKIRASLKTLDCQQQRHEVADM